MLQGPTECLFWFKNLLYPSYEHSFVRLFLGDAKGIVLYLYLGYLVNAYI